MNSDAEISCMFVELSYKQYIPELADRNTEMLERALAVRSTHDTSVNWHCNTFATLGGDYNLRADAVFAPLLEAATQKVLDFAGVYGVSTASTVTCKEAWLNVADPGAFQDVHIHPAAHFSAVYYVETPENCGDLLFKSHEASTDMYPLITESSQQANNKNFWHKAVAGTLVIFRSNLAHMVTVNRASSPRVSVAMNFVLDPPQAA